jgi:cbb3-type cytochrome oxidase maturation protein
VIGGAALAAFIWAARDDQFEDLDTPPTRALFEDLPAVGDATRGSKGDATPRIDASESANKRGSA